MSDYPRDARGLIDPVRAAEQDRERRRRFVADQADQSDERAKGREALTEAEYRAKYPDVAPFIDDPPTYKRGIQLAGAFQEGQDAALLGQACNPYRRAARALSDPGSLETLGKLAQQWEDGYVSNSK